MELITSVDQINKDLVKKIVLVAVQKNIAVSVSSDGFVSSFIDGELLTVLHNTAEHSFSNQYRINEANKFINALNNDEVTA